MNLLSTNRWTRLTFIALSLSMFLGATACGGKAKKADRVPSERRTLQTNTPAPTGEVLKDSPCGNPDWAKPPGSQGEDPVDPEFRATMREKSSANSPAEEPAETDDTQETADDSAESTN